MYVDPANRYELLDDEGLVRKDDGEKLFRRPPPPFLWEQGVTLMAQTATSKFLKDQKINKTEGIPPEIRLCHAVPQRWVLDMLGEIGNAVHGWFPEWWA